MAPSYSFFGPLDDTKKGIHLPRNAQPLHNFCRLGLRIDSENRDGRQAEFRPSSITNGTTAIYVEMQNVILCNQSVSKAKPENFSGTKCFQIIFIHFTALTAAERSS
nr:hypothetical protein Iba_chr03eCG10560 [Ipomoea batatas]GME19910.1 hypothetical protein Iba_scaffold24016CG0010 [Ipomoea batatas]